MEEKKVDVTPVSEKGKKEDLGNYELVSLTLLPGKVMEQIYLEAIPSYVRDKKVGGWEQPSSVSPALYLLEPIQGKTAGWKYLGNEIFQVSSEGFHIFTLSDCLYGHNILVAGIWLSAMRLLLHFLHSLSMLSGGASFLL